MKRRTFLDGYLQNATPRANDNVHVIHDGIDRMISGAWCINPERPGEKDARYRRGRSAGFVAICVGVDLSCAAC